MGDAVNVVAIKCEACADGVIAGEICPVCFGSGTEYAGGNCPYPLSNEERAAVVCIAKGDCGCDVADRNARRTIKGKTDDE